MLAVGCVLIKEEADGCVLHKEASEAGCVLVKAAAGCVLEKEAADKGCVLVKDDAGCVLHKEADAGCVLHKEADAGCVLAKDAAGCVLVKNDAGCVLHKEADAGCVLAKDAAGCVLAKDEAGCVLEKEAAGCVLAKEAAGCVLVKDSKDEEVALYLDRLNAWDMSLVKAHSVRKGIFKADEIDAIEREYKQFMAMSCVADSGAITVTPRVDDFWHAHILFTQDYAAMCKTVVGQFLHHRPGILDEARA